MRSGFRPGRPETGIFSRLEALLDRLLDLAPEEQEALLLDLARSDPELSRAARRALDQDDSLEDDLRGAIEQAVADIDFRTPAATSTPFLAPGPGDRIGAWSLLRSIGRGGMGEVFLAERADGRFAQQVAIKFLRPEWSQTELEARFLREGQILARLEHPSIARLLDSGIAATGIPYLVLEYVEGQPITEYCRIRQLKLVDRLLLILEVCEAVSYAHHHLVVHRDLKPSNIFVNQEGGVRLLDFGIGKLLDEVAGAESTRTILGALTPQYASPEQISGRPMSTATDVYGLGLVLFELLTEQRPYEIESSSAAELAHLVLETPAPLASLVSGRGGGNTVPWSRALRGDLDAIADKALRKEPAERYLSAEALAEDLRRFLAGLPVAARRGARGYRLGKYLWRHRLGLAAAATIFIAVAAGIAGVLWQARLAEGERRKAVASERKALAVNRFLIDELLGAASPEAARGRDLTVRQVLDVAARRVGSAFSEQPDLEEALHAALGEAFLDLGDLGAAAEHLERSVALTRSANARGADVALSNRILLSRLRLAQGRAVEAEALLEEVLAESSQPSIGRRAIEMGLARAWRGKARERQGRLDEAERDLRSAVDALASAGALATHDHLTALEMLAQTLVAGRKDTEGEATERVAVELARRELGADHPLLGEALANWSRALRVLGRLPEAEAGAREALALDERVLGKDHPQTLRALRVLAELLRERGQLDAALPLVKQELAGQLRTVGEHHPDAARAMEFLAILAFAQDRNSEAEAWYARALGVYRASLGERHPTTIRALRNQTEFWRRRGDEAQARRFAEELVAIAHEVSTQPNPDSVVDNDLAWFMLTARPPNLRDPALAHRLAERAVVATRRAWPDALDTLSLAEERLGRLDSALALETEAAELPDGLFAYSLEDRMVDLLSRRGEPEKVEKFLRRNLARRLAVKGADEVRSARTRQLLGAHLRQVGRIEEAEREQRAALATLENLRPPGDWRRVLGGVELAATLVAQGRHPEAEALLLAAWRSLEGLPAVEPSDRQAIAEGLAALYTVWSRPADAGLWQQRADEQEKL